MSIRGSTIWVIATVLLGACSAPSRTAPHLESRVVAHRSPRDLLIDEERQLAALVPQMGLHDSHRPAVLERHAEVLRELAALYRADAILLDPNAARLPLPRDASLGARLEVEQSETDPPPRPHVVRDPRDLAALRPESRAAIERADACLLEALVRYGDFLVDPTGLARRDRGYFGRARVLDELGQGTSARVDWYSLLNLFPESEYTPYAYIAFGDFFASQGHIDEARRSYEDAIEKGASSEAARTANAKIAALPENATP